MEKENRFSEVAIEKKKELISSDKRFMARAMECSSLKN